jgi:ketosteroid isomerase-like protein
MSTEEDVRTFNESFSAALARQDSEAAAEAYTEDARLLYPGHPVIHGRAAIGDLLRDSLAKGPSLITFETEQVWDGGTFVVDVGTYTSGDSAGKYVVVHERQPDGSLRMAVDAPSGNA